MRATLVGVVAALALVALVPASTAAPKGCPAAWAHGWQQLANRIQAPVYCPLWMPNPLDAKIGGDFSDIYSVNKDRSYLVSFLEHGDMGSGDHDPEVRHRDTERQEDDSRHGALFLRRRRHAQRERHQGDGIPRQSGRRPVARPARMAAQGLALRNQ
jgi:hypothetical protein